MKSSLPLISLVTSGMKRQNFATIFLRYGDDFISSALDDLWRVTFVVVLSSSNRPLKNIFLDKKKNVFRYIYIYICII